MIEVVAIWLRVGIGWFDVVGFFGMFLILVCGFGAGWIVRGVVLCLNEGKEQHG